MNKKQKLHQEHPFVFKTLKKVNQVRISVKCKLFHMINWKIFYPYLRINKLLLKKSGKLVLHGPFQGMRYINKSHGSTLAPKILGSYEEELHPIIEEIMEKNYRYILDIGCAEGYYAVGFAYRSPNISVHAYDIMFRAQKLCRKLANKNSCDNVYLHDECGYDEIKKYSNEKTFIFCDIEGAESVLMDNVKCPELNKLDFLIEMHDNKTRNITDALVKRFEKTHDIQIIKSVARNTGTFIERYKDCGLNAEDLAIALNEMRGQESWGYFCHK